jgi:hypothetical protein
MFKFPRPQKGDNDTELKELKTFEEVNFVEKSNNIRFFLKFKPFCYEQPSPLVVPSYDFGYPKARLCLTFAQVVHSEKFILSPEKEGV